MLPQHKQTQGELWHQEHHLGQPFPHSLVPNPQQKGAPPLPMPTLFPLRCIYSAGCAGEWTGKYPTLTPTPDIYMNLGGEAPASCGWQGVGSPDTGRAHPTPGLRVSFSGAAMHPGPRRRGPACPGSSLVSWPPREKHLSYDSHRETLLSSLISYGVSVHAPRVSWVFVTCSSQADPTKLRLNH